MVRCVCWSWHGVICFVYLFSLVWTFNVQAQDLGSSRQASLTAKPLAVFTFILVGRALVKRANQGPLDFTQQMWLWEHRLQSRYGSVYTITIGQAAHSDISSIRPQCCRIKEEQPMIGQAARTVRYTVINKTWLHHQILPTIQHFFLCYSLTSLSSFWTFLNSTFSLLLSVWW